MTSLQKPSTAVSPQNADSNSKASGDSKSSLENTRPEVVNDPAAVMVDEGFPRPNRGDKIYTWSNLPKDACGEYWVRSADGKVAKVAVCRDQH